MLCARLQSCLSRAGLSRTVFADACFVDEQMHRRKCENLAISCLEETAHVLATYLESAPSYASDNIVGMADLVTECAQTLNSAYFVSCGPVIFCEFSFYDSDWVKFIWNYEVWSLVETLDSLCSLTFAETNFRCCQNILDCTLEHATH